MGANTGCDLRVLRRLCPTTSIWTVDLAYLLRRFGADVTFCTITLGANPDFAAESFYRDNLNEDCARVDRLFATAAANGIAVERVSVGLEQLKEWCLSGAYLVIVLVDKQKLMRSQGVDPIEGSTGGGAAVPFGGASFAGGGAGERAQGEDRGVCSQGRRREDGGSGYTGHYIVVCGYDPAEGAFICRDPAAHRRDVTISTAALEAARRSFGTDEDLLLVRNAALNQGAVQAAVQDARAAGEAIHPLGGDCGAGGFYLA